MCGCVLHLGGPWVWDPAAATGGSGQKSTTAAVCVRRRRRRQQQCLQTARCSSSPPPAACPLHSREEGCRRCVMKKMGAAPGVDQPLRCRVRGAEIARSSRVKAVTRAPATRRGGRHGAAVSLRLGILLCLRIVTVALPGGVVGAAFSSGCIAAGGGGGGGAAANADAPASRGRPGGRRADQACCHTPLSMRGLRPCRCIMDLCTPKAF